MNKVTKDTLYIDADDDITAVIDKVVGSEKNLIAIVLPKRATVFQSPVNLKLLKKAAAGAKKNIVLITSDASITHLAAVSAVHVARTPTSKPVIPEAKHAQDDKAPTRTEEKSTEDSNDDDAIEIDNTDGSEPILPATAETKKKKKAFKIPDFTSFQMRLALGIGVLLLLIILWVVGFVIMPKATVTITTDTRTVAIDTTITTNTDQESVDVENKIIPAVYEQIEKRSKKTVEATGEENVGEKATGSATLTNCIDDGEQKIVPAGTRMTKDGQTFETAEQVILEQAVTSSDGSTCFTGDIPGYGGQKTVSVVASESGAAYNVSEGNHNFALSGIRAYGSDMTGGTDKTITVVSEEDVEGATQELLAEMRNEAFGELKEALEGEGLLVVEETFARGSEDVGPVPAVGKEAEETEVTVTVTYNLTGINREDLQAVLEAEAKSIVDDETQFIRDTGIDGATFTLSDRVSNAEKLLTVQTVAKVGPEFDEEQLREDVAGKTRGDIEKLVEAIEGVRNVQVDYSPGWITTTPKSADKIVIVFNEESQ